MQVSGANQQPRPDEPGAKRRRSEFGDRILTAENDDMDRVYVTRAIDKPFKIDALGGYDPEQDFQEAERELDDSQEPPARSTSGSRRTDKTSQKGDMNFNDADETDTMFNDASETDEITFAQDDPYQTDLEAEMRSQAFDKPTPDAAATVKEGPSEGVRVVVPQKRSTELQQDDSEGSWINDGVDEMDIPSQSHQDKVLEKAARQQEVAAAAIAAANENETSNAEPRADDEDVASAAETASDYQEQPVNDDAQPLDNDQEENQRMPNANYLKNLTDEPEDYEDNEAL